MGILVSLLILILTIAVVAAALGWALARGPWDGLWGLPLIVVHWYLALALLPLAIAHMAMRWRRAGRYPAPPISSDVAAWWRWRGLPRLRWRIGVPSRRVRPRANGVPRDGASPARARRDYGTPNGFFVTAFINDDPAPLDLAAWRLQDGLVARPMTLGHDDLRADAAVVATVDCTGGVYATREWAGLPLGALLDAVGVADGARMAWFISTTGHRWPLPIDEARRALLATHVGGEPLAHEHGFPLRLVAPERRGFQWVKSLDTIEIT